MTGILEAVPDLRRAGSTAGGEFAGPCPWCGGTDRFRVWPVHPSGRARFWCRRCERRGDSIDLLRELKGLTFREATAIAGETVVDRTGKDLASHRRIRCVRRREHGSRGPNRSLRRLRRRSGRPRVLVLWPTYRSVGSRLKPSAVLGLGTCSRIAVSPHKRGGCLPITGMYGFHEASPCRGAPVGLCGD